jgi:1-acyl-sn-glycerol-3-phosphate acyltransferase
MSLHHFSRELLFRLANYHLEVKAPDPQHESGPFVVAAFPHCEHFDSVVVASALNVWQSGIEIAAVGARDYWYGESLRHRLLLWLLNTFLIKTLPITRSEKQQQQLSHRSPELSEAQAIRLATRQLQTDWQGLVTFVQSGKSVIIFPQGSRQGPGRSVEAPQTGRQLSKQIHSGVMRLSRETVAPILPVVISHYNSNQYVPRPGRGAPERMWLQLTGHSVLPNMVRVELHPLLPVPVTDKDVAQTKAQLTEVFAQPFQAR